MAIRYDKQLQSEIRRTVANFNRKISRLETQGRELIPDRVYTRDLKDQYSSRYELKRKLKELRRFSQRGVEEVIKNEQGVRFTKWSLDNLKREIRRANYNLNREARELQKRITPLTITRKSAYNALMARSKVINKDLSKITSQQLRVIEKNINRVLDYDKKAEQFQENLFQILFSEAGMSGVDELVIDDIQSELAKLSPQDLVKLSREDPNIQAILDYSPTKGNIISSSRMQDILVAIQGNLSNILANY